MGNINVAKVSLDQHILANLISVEELVPLMRPRLDPNTPIDERVVEPELEQEVAQLVSDLGARTFGLIYIRCQNTQGED